MNTICISYLSYLDCRYMDCKNHQRSNTFQADRDEVFHNGHHHALDLLETGNKEIRSEVCDEYYLHFLHFLT